MRNSRIASFGRFVGIVAIPLAMAAASSVASAQYQNGGQYPDRRDRNDRIDRGNGQQELFEWAGRVDREIRIRAGNGEAQIINMGSNERNNGGRFRSMNRVPSRDGTVTVQVLEGRGRVDVIQQPSRRNGYTTVIRMRDPDGGASRYRIAAYFQPNRDYRRDR
jgi:hypothetical protein